MLVPCSAWTGVPCSVCTLEPGELCTGIWISRGPVLFIPVVIPEFTDQFEILDFFAGGSKESFS